MTDQDQSKRTEDTRGAISYFLTRLKEYKEFIAIIAFFMGGIMWIYGFFATKNEVKVLRCLMNNQIILIEARINKKFLPAELARMKAELAMLEKYPSDDPFFKQGIYFAKTNIDLTEKALSDCERKYQQSLDILSTNQCQSPD